MIELNDELRLMRYQVRDQHTWVCQRRCPSNTWKNRALWKPITPPLTAEALTAWLSRNALSTPLALQP